MVSNRWWPLRRFYQKNRRGILIACAAMVIGAVLGAKRALDDAGTQVASVNAPYYSDCNEARAAGAAPIHRGSPGYRRALDRDNDGVACDPWRASENRTH